MLCAGVFAIKLIEEEAMFKKVSLFSTALLLAAVAAQAEEPAPYNCDFSPSCEVAPGVYGAMASPVLSKFNMSIGGYVKLDYVHNTSAVGPISPGAPGGGLTAGNHKEESLFTAKQSRFWLKVAGPALLGAKTNALIEADFYGGTSYPMSNDMPNLRLRHAYGSMDWTNTQVLFGQFWDIFGPAAADTIDFRQGATTGAPSNPRVPQIRLTQKINFNPNNSLKFVLGVQQPVQDAAVAGDGSSSKTAGYGDLVNVAGQIVFSSKSIGVSPGFMGLGMSPLQIGAFGLGGSQKVTGNRAVDVWGYGLYTFVPIIKSSDGKHRNMTLSFEGQAYNSAGLEVQGATPATLVGTAPNKTGAKGYGIYGQLKFYPTQDLGITGGYLRRNAVDYDSLRATNAAFEKYNELAYGNLTYDLNAAIRVATEYEHMYTQYAARPTGAGANYGQNNTFRVAAYYFF
jgi:hypothetical protein